MLDTVLFVSHKPKQCGVYEFGVNIFNAICLSKKFNFISYEVESKDELLGGIQKHHPKFIIYNYHPSVMPWLVTKISKGLYKNNIADIDAIHIGIIHEVTQHVADTATAYKNKYVLGGSEKKLNSFFDFYIAPDPTLLLKNPYVFKTERLIPYFQHSIETPSQITIGSFGFATPNKGFEKLIEEVQNNFEVATIRLNIPNASFGDANGNAAKKIAENCQNKITKPGITLQISNDYLNNNDLLLFLAENSMNVFLYEDQNGRGISSALDQAIAVKRPIAVSRCKMFRHVLKAEPSVCIENNSLSQILKNGFEPVQKISKNWNQETILWDYERILARISDLKKNYFSDRKGVIRTLKSIKNKLFTQPDTSFTWLRNTDFANDDNLLPDFTIKYQPVDLKGRGLNGILDDRARELYASAIQKLIELAPSTMSKKIARANVQQAFVFDTVFRFIKNEFSSPKMLCVGSYEDTASMALQKMGYAVEEVDPMINYYLQEYYTKPGIEKGTYDIVFSTSVIEHDPDDKSFLQCIQGLLKVNGIAVITCDYKDGWKPGDPKPGVDARFYTKADMEKRMLSYLPDCELVDKGEWDCPNPDFFYMNTYQYTFATFVFRKIKKLKS